MLVKVFNLSINVLASIVVSPLIFKVVRILVRTRSYAKHRSAFADTSFILAGSIFGNSPSDQCSDQSACQTAGTGTSETSSDRSPNNKSETRQKNIRSNSRNAADDRAE